LIELQRQGKIRHIGLSNVTTDQLATARQMTPIASVQNRYNLTDRSSEDVLEACERAGIGFIPWFPLATGDLARPGSPVDRVSRSHNAAPSQIALAWLLQRSPVMLPIPGTSATAHMEENVAAAGITLSQEEFAELSGVAGG
jgi:aryl-alcohol dehydrogenase-like predicted oxidoreductase